LILSPSLPLSPSLLTLAIHRSTLHQSHWDKQREKRRMQYYNRVIQKEWMGVNLESIDIKHSQCHSDSRLLFLPEALDLTLW